MLVVEIVRSRNCYVIPTCPIVSLVTSDQKDRYSPRVEGEQDADASCPQLLHVRMSRLRDRIDERTSEPGPAPF